jgi:hypothetical protein
MTKTVYTREAKRVSDWWTGSEGQTAQTMNEVVKIAEQKKADLPFVISPGTAIAKWNLGRQMHQVKIGDKVVFETPDKELAHQIADGKTPIPEAA